MTATRPATRPAARPVPTLPETIDPRRLLPEAEVRRLDNGLTVCALVNRRSPVVATALVYGAGTRDESPAEAGCAHFLEHMMFKGSQHWAEGEIDRTTRALGGSNNAFTGHDSTLYYFTFAADRWRRALDIEADRMAALNLAPGTVESERRVIVEEIAMYEGEPWDVLERRVAARLFGRHAYGRPVLGTRDSLQGIDADVLGDFHRRFYRPGNAVLAVAGDLDEGVFDAVTEAFGGLDGEPERRPRVEPAADLEGLERLERRSGETARMLLAWHGPAADHPDHPLLAALLGILATGRASRLHQALVDDGELCTWVTADVQETLDPGAAMVALELLPGVDREQVEERVFEEIERLRQEGPTADEVARAQRILLADWVFGNERVYQQAFLAASALALWDLDHPWRYFDTLLAAGRDDLVRCGERWLCPRDGGVLGWSLPEGNGSRGFAA